MSLAEQLLEANLDGLAGKKAAATRRYKQHVSEKVAEGFDAALVRRAVNASVSRLANQRKKNKKGKFVNW